MQALFALALDTRIFIIGKNNMKEVENREGKFRIYRILEGGIDTSPVEKNLYNLQG